MKRIMISLIMIMYMGVLLFSVYDMKNNSYSKLMFENNSYIQVEDWENNIDINEKVEQIKQYALDNKVNIIKVDNTDRKTQTMYCAIGNPEEFCKQLKINYSKYINISNGSTEWRISNIQKKNNNEKSLEIKSFFNEQEIIYCDMSKNNSSVVGKYILTDNVDDFIKCMKFKADTDGSTIISNVDTILGLAIILFILIYIITYVYYVVENQKKIAVCRMLGWKERSILSSVFIKIDVMINGISIVLTILIATIYLFFYSKLHEIIPFMKKLVLNDIILMCILLVISVVIIYIIKDKDINTVIKNKRPIRQLTILNVLLKTVLVLGIIFSMLMQIPNIQLYKKNYYIVNKLEKSYNYASIKINSIYGCTSDTKIIAQVAPKLNDLYKEEDKRGAMLSCWINIDEEDYLFINNNYLFDNTIYDENGNRIQESNLNKDTITLLIPEKYKDNDENILSKMTEWYNTQKYIEKYLKEENKNYRANNLDKIKFECKYIKNNQHLVTYNIDNVETNDSVLCVVNGENLSNDTYLTFFAVEGLYRKVNPNNDLYGQFKEEIIRSNLTEEVTGIQLIRDKFSSYLYDMKKLMSMLMIIIILLVLFLILVIYFMCENYLESVKKINAIRYIHGYSFWDRHKKHILNIGLQYIILVVLLLCMRSSIISMIPQVYSSYKVMVINICLVVMVIDVVFSVLLIKVLEKTNIKDILKEG